MQQLPTGNASVFLDRVIAEVIPDKDRADAWQSFPPAHASLMRQLTADLIQEVGPTLGDFDVLAQLAQAGGEVRMTDLAAQAYSSRSGMTRRIDRLVAESLVLRANTDTDGRGVVVGLTEVGVARLGQAAPAHLRRVSELSVSKLTRKELLALTTALWKVASIVDLDSERAPWA